MLLGEEAMEILSDSHVAVFGLGGVGSWCAEALARTGIGTLTLVDSDAYSVTNINRQSEALWKNTGRAKAVVMAERMKEIHPDIRLYVREELYNAESRDKFFPFGEQPYHFLYGNRKQKGCQPSPDYGSFQYIRRCPCESDAKRTQGQRD